MILLYLFLICLVFYTHCFMCYFCHFCHFCRYFYHLNASYSLVCAHGLPVFYDVYVIQSYFEC